MTLQLLGERSAGGNEAEKDYWPCFIVKTPVKRSRTLRHSILVPHRVFSSILQSFISSHDRVSTLDPIFHQPSSGGTLNLDAISLSHGATELHQNCASPTCDKRHIGNREKLRLRYVTTSAIRGCVLLRVGRQIDFCPLHEGRVG